MADIIPLRDHRRTHLRELRTLDGRWYWDARIYVERHLDLEDRREYSILRLAEEFGLTRFEGRPFLPLPENMARLPESVIFAVEPIG